MIRAGGAGEREEAPSWMDRQETPGVGRGTAGVGPSLQTPVFSSPLMISRVVSLPSCSPRLPEGTALCFRVSSAFGTGCVLDKS